MSVEDIRKPLDSFSDDQKSLAVQKVKCHEAGGHTGGWNEKGECDVYFVNLGKGIKCTILHSTSGDTVADFLLKVDGDEGVISKNRKTAQFYCKNVLGNEDPATAQFSLKFGDVKAIDKFMSQWKEGIDGTLPKSDLKPAATPTPAKSTPQKSSDHEAAISPERQTAGGGGGLFGGLGDASNNAFGSSNTGGSLFGGGSFGASNTGGGMFGSANTSGSMFGAPSGGGMFGSPNTAGSMFGAPSGGGIFGGGAPDSSGAAPAFAPVAGHATNADGDDGAHEDLVKEEEVTEIAGWSAEYTAEVGLVVTTGEEGEEAVWENRAKLYRFNDDDQEWKERGAGNAKLLKAPETGSTQNIFYERKFKFIHKHFFNFYDKHFSYTSVYPNFNSRKFICFVKTRSHSFPHAPRSYRQDHRQSLR